MNEYPTILWLYHPLNWGDSRGIARRIHYDFVKKLNGYCNLFIYGPEEHEINGSDLSPLAYDKNYDLLNLIRYFDPDLLLVYTYSSVMRWASAFLSSFCRIEGIPKVCIEVDYQDVPKDWYRKCGFDLLIHRGCWEDPDLKIPSVWLPFSCSEDLTVNQTKSLYKRKREIVFIGRGLKSNERVYPIRKQAVKTLQEAGLVVLKGDNGVVDPKYYSKTLGSSYCALSDCAYVINSPVAKIFEIMGSGTMLFSPKIKLGKVLFGDKKYHVPFNEDMSDIKEKAEWILDRSNYNECKEISNNAKEAINKEHLDNHRIEELVEIFNALLLDKKIPKKWGV